jgi:hypothetical protein
MLWLAQAIARLHNYCINERLAASQSSFEVPVQLLHAFQGTNDGSHSYLREHMALRVQQKQIWRPGNNENGSTSQQHRNEMVTGVL